MSAPKIPTALEGDILTRAGQGASAADLAAWLGADHGIEVSDRSVRTFLEKRRREREPIARAVIVENVTKSITTDLDALEYLAGKAREILQRATMGEKLQPSIALDAIKTELAVRAQRLKFAGGDEADGPKGDPRAASAVILLSPRRATASPQIPTSPPTSSESPSSGPSEGDP